MPVDLGTLTRVDPGQVGAVGGRDRRADRAVALSYTDVVTQTACWEERSQVCDEIRLALAEVRRRTPSAEPAWGPRGTTPRLTVRGTAAGAPPPPPPPHRTSPHVTSRCFTSPHLTSLHVTSPPLPSPLLPIPSSHHLRQARCGVAWHGGVGWGGVWCGMAWWGGVWCGVVCRRRCYQKAKGRDVYPRVQVNGLGCVCCVRAVCKCVVA